MIVAVFVIVLGFSSVIASPWSGQASAHEAYPEVNPPISCPHDRVVWVNTRSGVYHLAGERWFGRTKSGQFECEKQALQEGDRETRNGQ